MPDIINLLPDAIANQIAAGEVVQRPASVVKELLENSVDAGSSSIHLIINEAGKNLIQVIDNGIGMSETDARMSFERHATSKIRSSEDLFKINTMGFRGEALASIAAVSRVELKSRTHNKELGTYILIEASTVKKQEPIAQNQGSSLSIKNLFYNVPARRNFLKSNPVETRHIIDEFQRIALAHPEIALKLTQDSNEVYDLSRGKLSQRIVSLFTKNHQQQLIACQEETHWLKVTGYIGKPEFSKKTRGEQFFFVNNRFIKSNYLNHAVLGAFEGLIKPDHFPFYVLFIELDPIHIDINVHPTKTEIKFDDERSVYGIIKSAVRQALGTHNVTPAIDFNADVNFESLAVSNLNFNTPSSKENNYGSFKSLDQMQGKAAHWEKMYEGALKESTPSPEEIRQEELAGFKQKDLSIKNTSQNQIKFQEDIKKSSLTPTLLHDKYIMKQVQSGVMILDICLAHERILYERFLRQLENKSGTSQKCIFPISIELNPADYAMVFELKEEINGLGFDFEAFGKNSIAINGIPAEVNSANEKELFEGLIEQFKYNKSDLSISVTENMARSLARRAASRVENSNSSLELSTLIDRLFACEQPNYTPKGTPTFVILALEKIADFFNH
ncbi:MAG: DNA mismatch repair endonuclease MutL [Reichenbachiella sp.]